jgi:two-component system sensor histidine kinase DevS
MTDEQAAVPPGSALTEDAFRRAIDAVPDGVLVVDEAGTIVFVNPMVEQLFEYRPGELVGISVDCLVPQGARQLHARHRAGYGIAPTRRVMGEEMDLLGRRRSGTEFPVEVSLSPLQGRGRMLVIAIIRDITHRRDADRAIERAAAALTLLDERERIARDLHDTVIQHLFAVGLSLQAAASGAGPGLIAERVQQAVDGIDRTIREIRSTIFALQSRRPGGSSLRDEITAVAHEAAPSLGFEPTIAFDGPIDSAATDAMCEQLVATLREALSNVARHAHATSVNVDVVLKRDNLMLYVCDDGIGMMDSTQRGNGVPNMHARAVALGGRCRTSSPNVGGTVVNWWVPIGDA